MIIGEGKKVIKPKQQSIEKRKKLTDNDIDDTNFFLEDLQALDEEIQIADNVYNEIHKLYTNLTGGEYVPTRNLRDIAELAKNMISARTYHADAINKRISLKKTIVDLKYRANGGIDENSAEAMTNYARQIVSNTLPLTDSSKNYLGANSVLQQATSGEYSGILSWTNASMGMRKIDPTNFNRVVLTDGKITSVDFPYKILNDNTIVPDLSPETSEAKFLADKEIRQRGIDLSDKESIRRNYQTINQIYINHKLDPAYNPDGTPAEKWMRFGIINASASNTTLGMG